MAPGDELELRQVFDPESRVDRFVFLLFETLADLGTMESRMKGNLFGEGTSVAQTLYLQRHLAARVEDSWRVVAAIRDHEEIRQFVADAGATREAEWLLAKLTKAPGSEAKTPVQELFQADRQRTVHLATVDSAALRETLEAAADEVVQIGVYDGGRKKIVEFPEAAISRAIFGDPNQPQGKMALRERAEMIEQILQKFRTLGEKCLNLHLARRGINLKRLYVKR